MKKEMNRLLYDKYLTIWWCFAFITGAATDSVGAYDEVRTVFVGVYLFGVALMVASIIFFWIKRRKNKNIPVPVECFMFWVVLAIDIVYTRKLAIGEGSMLLNICGIGAFSMFCDLVRKEKREE